MGVFYCHAEWPWHLDYSNHMHNSIICHQGLACWPVLMITPTQLNHKSQIYIIQKKNRSWELLPHNADTRPTQTNTIPEDNRIITTKEQILRRFPDVFEGIGKFPGKPYEIQLDPKVPPKQTPCRPIPIHLKDTFKWEIDKMLKAGVLKPVQEATPWINSFVLIEGTDKQGKPKLCICLDPTNLNKAIIRELYHFKTPEDISHLPIPPWWPY